MELLFMTAHNYVNNDIVIQKQVTNAIANYISDIDVVQHFLDTAIDTIDSDKNRINTTELFSMFKNNFH